MNQICFNGKYLPAETPAILPTNRSYRYGDGLFETIRLVRGAMPLAAYHFERLFSGIGLLEYEVPALFTPAKIQQQIILLCERNGCGNLARVRLSVFRGNGGLYDDDRKLQYMIECWPLDEEMVKLNTNGLVIGIYPHARKSCDALSNLKSASFLPYAAAAEYAKKNKLNDCILLNTQGSLADSTIANIFLVKEKKLITPPLSEGCVNGVMRRYLLEQMKKADIDCTEEALSPDDLENADEVFLTNAIRGVRWVKEFGNRTYTNAKAVEIFNRFIKTI
jgi:branched-chain amino acid aminotransferase